MTISLSTKAGTLESLVNRIKSAIVLPQVNFTVGDWYQDKESVYALVQNKFNDKELIVRSSALNEDTEKESLAGKYSSVLHIKGKDNFIKAVEEVIDSFGSENINDQILIQPMLDAVMLSGVAFTMDPSTNGNYYVINYDDTSRTTDSITSGNNIRSKLFYCFKEETQIRDANMQKVVQCLKELEELFGQENLDVEFAIDFTGKLYIFQVRALCVPKPLIGKEEQGAELRCIREKIKRENRPKPFLNGKKTIYGVMPDWNPAEMIGIRPKPLALSLYKEIITDNIWAYQRDNYGYKNLRSFPLLIDFSGLPYIDVRVSFNSFIPRGLSEDLSEKLVNYYLDRLEENPELHDKIEFEIVYSCYTLDLPERIQKLSAYGFTQNEIHEITLALRDMTNIIIDNEQGLWKKDYGKIELLDKRYQKILESDLDKVSKIYWLLEDCKRYGTLPFAGLARAGFIAVQFLDSMVSKAILSKEEYDSFMKDLNTVSTSMNSDIKQLSKAAFIQKYGHLRPGTYDINSKRYDEAPDLYFEWKEEQETASMGVSEFKLTLKQISDLKILLRESGMSEDILGTFQFIKTAIEGREFAKFIFSKSLSQAIKLIGELGQENGYAAEACAFADISIIRQLYSSSTKVKVLLDQTIKYGMEKYKMTECITLPPLILNDSTVTEFYFPDTQPNYITLRCAIGELCLLKKMEETYAIKGKIVAIPSADPGYDWIFSHDIKGFITKYGGANSHMAIRAGELGIPAVIGVGEKMFEKIGKASMIEIDAAAKKVSLLK